MSNQTKSFSIQSNNKSSTLRDYSFRIEKSPNHENDLIPVLLNDRIPTNIQGKQNINNRELPFTSHPDGNRTYSEKIRRRTGRSKFLKSFYSIFKFPQIIPNYRHIFNILLNGDKEQYKRKLPKSPQTQSNKEKPAFPIQKTLNILSLNIQSTEIPTRRQALVELFEKYKREGNPIDILLLQETFLKSAKEY